MSSDSTPGAHDIQPMKSGLGPSDVVVVLGRQKWKIGAWTAVAAALGLLYGYWLPPTYTGVARMLPPPNPQTTTSMVMGQAGGGAGGLSSMLPGYRNMSELYVGLLKSDTVADAIVERFRLKDLYGVKYAMDARIRLAGQTRFTTEKSGIITIAVEVGDPKLAADLANAYVDELHQLSTTLVVNDAGQRRAYFGRQLEITKDKLAEAETKLRQAMDAGGIVSIDVRGRAAVENVERLRAQIAAKEIQIASMRSYAGPANPDLQRAEDELTVLRTALTRAEMGSGAKEPDSRDPRGLANIRLLREVKYQELLFEQLARLYELARADEGKQAPLAQVLDRASPPERRSSPRRARILLATTALGFILSAGYYLAAAALQAARHHPDVQPQLDAIRSAWSLRKR